MAIKLFFNFAGLLLPPMLIILLTMLSYESYTVTAQQFPFKEATISEIQLAFQEKRLTSKQLVEYYLREIERLNPTLKGVIEVNPDALSIADRADRERAIKAPTSLSSLHGIPILLKDNIGTKDKLNTTDGSFALLGSMGPRDAGVVAKLRKAGAIILGKASLNEWSSFRSTNAPNGWSARGGYGKMSYIFKIYCHKILQRPICRTVQDAVYVLDVIVGIDYNDPATINASKYIPPGGYKQYLKVDGLKGKRLGIVREPFISLLNDSDITQAFEKHTETLRKMGADVIDNLQIATIATNGIGEREMVALANLERLSRDGFEKSIKDNKLDAVVTPGSIIYHALAIGGYPGINVPAGYNNKGVPFGINFAGLKGSEPKLIEIAYRFEQATKIRKPPSFKP
ncbi:Carbon-nitrogen ligase [Spatholobus suberectus]|nr:Carbon-nitrogen ligase [Spatholobus suberectus]